MAPWADVLYACDFAWWEQNNGVMSFNGLKVSSDKPSPKFSWNVRTISLIRNDDRLQLAEFGTLGWGGNSGFHALNLAVQFGASRIVLVGYDMRVDRGVHWHGKHGGQLNNPTEVNVQRWRGCIDDAAETLRAIGVEVINASPVSTLENYPKMSLEEAIGWH